MNINFVDRFAEALRVRGLKQTDISSRSGIAPGTISNYAQGKYAPKDENLRKIAAALRVNPAWLMGFDVPMSSDDDLLQILQDPSPAQLEWLEYQKSQALSDQERLLIDRYRAAGENVRRSICALLEVDYE